MYEQIKQLAKEAHAIQSKGCMDAALLEIIRLCNSALLDDAMTEAVTQVTAHGSAAIEVVVNQDVGAGAAIRASNMQIEHAAPTTEKSQRARKVRK